MPAKGKGYSSRMLADAMEDLEITLRVRAEMELRRQAEHNPKIDPSLLTPWGRMGLLDYREFEVNRQ